MKRTAFLVGILLIVANCLAKEQTSTEVSSDDSARVRITLKDGSVLIGKILQKTEQTLQFQTDSGVEMSLPMQQIEKIETLTPTSASTESSWEDPNQTRLLFSPTARPLKRYQAYFSIYQLFFPMIAVGLTDFLSVGMGMSLVPFATSQVVYLAPRVTVLNLPSFSVSGGILHIFPTKGSLRAGIIYGVSTYTTSDFSLTGGLGWGYAGDEVANDPVLMLGGDVRISRHLKFISENWFPPHSDVQIVSFGLRFYGQTLAGDFALLRFLGVESEGFPFVPWVGFAYHFQAK